jgi:hypothetical protein
MVLRVRDLADFGVGAGTMRAGKNSSWPGKPVVYVVLQVGRVRLSQVLRDAAGYVSALL